MGRVHIRCLGNGYYRFRPYGGSLCKSGKVSKTLLPHHSAPRPGSVCPLSGLKPWAAVMGHPWPRTANPASCRVTHGFKPAFGQRGLTGRLRSRSKDRSLVSLDSSYRRNGVARRKGENDSGRQRANRYKPSSVAPQTPIQIKEPPTANITIKLPAK